MPSSQQSGLKATLGAPGKETLTCRVEGGDGGGQENFNSKFSKSQKSLENLSTSDGDRDENPNQAFKSQAFSPHLFFL